MSMERPVLPDQTPEATDYIYDEKSGTYVPVYQETMNDETAAYQTTIVEDDIIPYESDEVLGKKNVVERTAMKKIKVGMLALSIVAVPVASHVAAEVGTHEVVNFLDPRVDRELTTDMLYQDFQKSVQELITSGDQ